ncbi:MAG: FMN-binding protein [Sphaerochaetaceae bacterium]
MTKNLKYGLILLSLCAVCAFALALTNSVTAPVIVRLDLERRNQALEAVSAGYTFGEQVTVEGDRYVTYSMDLTENGELVGYIIGLQSAGYGGQMTLVASYTLEGEMLAAQVLNHSETPGLGAKAANASYMDKFRGTGSEKAVPTTKDMLSDSDAQSVSGASVTFAAVGKAIEAGSSYVKTLGGEK